MHEEAITLTDDPFRGLLRRCLRLHWLCGAAATFLSPRRPRPRRVHLLRECRRHHFVDQPLAHEALDCPLDHQPFLLGARFYLCLHFFARRLSLPSARLRFLARRLARTQRGAQLLFVCFLVLLLLFLLLRR